MSFSAPKVRGRTSLTTYETCSPTKEQLRSVLKMRQTITRICEFDAAHRVMNERVKCYNLHGHRFKVEITFSFEQTEEIGYAIDFKEIKRIACQWIDEHLDHAGIFNPEDTGLIDMCKKEGWRLFPMGLGNEGYCNPTAENISAELFAIIKELMKSEKLLTLENIRLYETPNCWVDTSEPPVYKMTEKFLKRLQGWRLDKGTMNYSNK